MFEKNFLSLKHLNYVYLFVNLLSYAFIFSIILLNINDCYHTYLKENHLFQQSQLISDSTIHLNIFLKNLLWKMFISAGKISIYVSIVIFIKFLVLKIPLTSNYLINLDKNKEISSILGRFLSYYFRKNTSINFSTLVFLNQEAEYEQYIIKYHAKETKFKYFLKKYDKFYNEDLNN